MTNEMWQAIIHNDPSYDGEFYYGVKTTGIFCRPSCKSKNPSKEHVRIFLNVDQAISDNFRPCKRCRPDGKRLPEEEWVLQITHVIEEHFQEQLTLAELADRIHSSPYHMHRTFKRIKGITPVEYIQRKRMEEAKKLLSETGMAITDVAMSVGFPNAAHFSTIFQKKTGRSPTDYRLSFGMIKLTVPKEFSFGETVNYLSRSSNECMFHVENNKIYKRIPVEQEKPLVEISGDQEGVLHIRFLGNTSPSNKGVRAAAARYVREWFDLDTDLVPFYELAQNDILLQKVVNRFYGLRNIGIPDLFEALCWGIIGQQINLAFAYTLKRRFVESFGQYVEWNDRKYWIFPSPDDIASLKVSDLTGLQMTAKKSEYLIGVAQLMAEGKLTKELLLGAGDFKAAEKQLVSIRGIGPWTANYVLMRCLRSPSAFPIDDVGLHNAIKQLMGIANKPSLAEIRQLSSAWTNWESYATFYLWRSIY